jgi:hypothetical protein
MDEEDTWQVSSTAQVTIELTMVGEREKERERERKRDDLLITYSLSTLE